MPLAKCARCDKLFDKAAIQVCSECLAAEETDYETVRLYLAENPDTAADKVSEATGVDVLCVLRMVDSGRIVNAANAANVKCGRCGAPAICAAKRLCTQCLESLNQELLKQRNQVKATRRKDVQIGQHASARRTLDSKREQSN